MYTWVRDDAGTRPTAEQEYARQKKEARATKERDEGHRQGKSKTRHRQGWTLLEFLLESPSDARHDFLSMVERLGDRDTAHIYVMREKFAAHLDTMARHANKEPPESITPTLSVLSSSGVVLYVARARLARARPEWSEVVERCAFRLEPQMRLARQYHVSPQTIYRRLCKGVAWLEREVQELQKEIS